MLRVAMVGKLLVPDDQLEHIHEWTKNPDRRRRLIPFSAMISIGVVITLVLAFVYAPR
jgi:hypothetical protein